MNFLRLIPLFAFAATAHAAEKADMFPFQLPWDDASESATNISWLNDKPAGRDGFAHVKDGHLFAGEKRLRIFGVNTCFAANFPDKDMAPKIAARMAKFGINCVRFHHMDMLTAPAGIFAKDGRTLDPGQLDRLDFFIAELKKNGIYADLNLHVSRTYPDRPREEKKGNPDYDKGVDNYCAAMIALQRDYARDLLTHVNAYTGNRYADEPAVALVEINNENAFGFQWWAGQMDDLPAPYRGDLESLWGAWILKKYGGDEKARRAWSEGARDPGPELLAGSTKETGRVGVPPAGSGVSPEPSGVERPPHRDTPSRNERPSTPGGPRETRAPAGGTPTLPDARASRVPWSFENHGGAVQTHSEKDGAITVNIEKPGTENWHVQFSAAPLAVKAETYEVRFRVRAAKDTSLSVSLMQSHEPWKVLGSANVKAGSDWREVSATIQTSDADDKARLTIGGMGTAIGAFEFTRFSLRTAAVDGSFVRGEKGSVAMLRKRHLPRTTPAKLRDWQEFIWDTETAYWNGMRDFLKKDLGVKAPIVGTQGMWSPGHVQAGMDVIDSHAYWHHPDFHGKGWNPDVWDVKNEPMAGAPDGGTLPGLAAQRVAGKPFLCTEYNHPVPNTYSAETFPLLCAFAALQDWDGVFAFSYSHRAGDAWSQEHFNNFFDIDRHPVKMATLPGAVVSFRRGDIEQWLSGNRYGLHRNWTLEFALLHGPMLGAPRSLFDPLEAMETQKSWEISDIGENEFPLVKREHPYEGLSTFSIMHHRVGAGLEWKSADDCLRIESRKSSAMLGRVAKRQAVSVSSAKIAAGNDRNKWICIQLTVLDQYGDFHLAPYAGPDFSTAKRILITATGDIENTGMGWKNAAKTSVGRDWGKAPVLVEGPAAKIELPGGGKFKAWALDERGQRRAEIPVADGVLEIGPQHRTLWYEVVRE